MLGGRSLREGSPSGSHHADGCIPLQGREQRRTVGDCRAWGAMDFFRGPRAARRRAAAASIQSRTGPLSRGSEQNDFHRSIEAPQAVRASTPPSQRFGPLGRSAERKEGTHHFMRPGTVTSLRQTHMSSPGARGRQQSRRTEGNPGWVKASRQQQRAALEDLFLFIELLQQREKSALGNLIGRS